MWLWCEPQLQPRPPTLLRKDRATDVTFDDLTAKSGKEKAGYNKIKFCGDQAARDGLQYFWYRRAERCYVFLADVSTSEGSPQSTWEPVFRTSRWFTRGWTLQELLAPKSVEFFSKEGVRLGDRESLKRQIFEITGIPLAALSGTPLTDFSVKERMRWAKGRTTQKFEDMAYCLQGIFGVYMPPIYGEKENAFRRLDDAIDGLGTRK
ncbi:hypothetical protein NA57DRAFT_62847 [Rhizodiscina lignyota]|uniref:Heterokaryon incompatibility domain-containing protein n=1 Tax=Rhizodiscina lignyota TaxID=1504668 RepID=A0A9P4IRS3_9PEZI|nr:hypothetical protein NA57DRAFT_62847 [Rhizodiscina lignyota]